MKLTYRGVLGGLALACVLTGPPQAGADVLELKNGQVLTGRYVGGTAGTIRFETGSGVRVVEASQALALTFTAEAAPAESPAPAAVVATPPAAAGSVTVPVGTPLLVRMADGVSSQSPPGKRFATALEADLIVNGVMVAKAGTKVYGRVEQAKQAGRMAGKSVLDLRLCELTVGAALVPIMTGAYAQAGANSLGKTVKGAAAGAAIGALASGSDDVAKGAAIGALASGLKKGQAIVVPPGTLLEFELRQPVTLNPR
jgi:hypothetical protein